VCATTPGGSWTFQVASGAQQGAQLDAAMNGAGRKDLIALFERRSNALGARLGTDSAMSINSSPLSYSFVSAK